MANVPSRHRKPWTSAECNRLLDLRAKGLSFLRIGDMMGRTESACGRVHWALTMGRLAEHGKPTDTLRIFKKGETK